jgi:hypothetical protein
MDFGGTELCNSELVEGFPRIEFSCKSWCLFEPLIVSWSASADLDSKVAYFTMNSVWL